MVMVMIHIDPIDTFFFRDSRSFTAGEVNTAEFNFPSPLSFFGAIGNSILDSLKDDEKNRFFQRECDHPKLGKYSEELNLEETHIRLKGIFLHIGNDIYFPSPANLWVSGTGSIYLSQILYPYGKELLKAKTWQWDLDKKVSSINTKDIRPLVIPDQSLLKFKPLNQFISIEYMTQYLNGNLETLITSKSEHDFFMHEIRYGHAISKSSKTPEKKFLYSAPHLRFIDNINEKYTNIGFTLVVEGVDESDFPDKTIYLGGERRKATLTFEDELNLAMADTLKKMQENKRFFIYLATPAIFQNGWCIDLPSDFNGAKLVGAAVNKPLYVSGWKSKSTNPGGEPRPIKKTVPSGSVYFFEVDWDDNKIKEIYEKYFFGYSFSSIYQAAGFGIGLLGSW